MLIHTAHARLVCILCIIQNVYKKRDQRTPVNYSSKQSGRLTGLLNSMMFVFALVLCLCGLQPSNPLSLDENSIPREQSILDDSTAQIELSVFADALILEDSPDYQHIGCFKDTTSRALPDYLGTFQKNIAIQKCAQLAKERGFTTFSVQNGRQCFTGTTASKTYNKYGPASNCANGLGGTWANDVYMLPEGDYKHIGCFKDTTNRALPDHLGTFQKSIAIQKCVQLAKERGFTTFSVQNGGQCFTGTTTSKTYNKYGPASNCANGLGGTWANDVYLVNSPEYKHIGCFKDTKNRALPNHLGTFQKNVAIRKCAELAQKRGFPVFSIQYGGQCFTGTTTSQTYNKYGPATNCANGRGGTWANDVYMLPKADYKRIGCFKDTTSRALTDYLGTFQKNIAIQKCAQLAKERGFTTFSVQNGGQCFTGATASKTHDKYGQATNCANGLGGSWANDVYSLRAVEYNYVGCFKDTQTRALPNFLGKFKKNIAIQKCAQLVKERGFAMFSVQNRGQCFTGSKASQTYNRFGHGTNCGNGLGGTWANDVYMLPKADHKHIGCFKDTVNRALPDFLGTFQKSTAIQMCAQLAKQRGFSTLSVQNGGQCFTGAKASQTYNKYGLATNCANGLGGSWANDVYSVSGGCTTKNNVPRFQTA